MKNKIVGVRMDGNLYVHVDDHHLDPKPSQKIINHSPDGFEAGYAGSGPAQLALAILLHMVGKERAQRHYQDFKFEFLANPDYLHSNFFFFVDIGEWVRQREG